MEPTFTRAAKFGSQRGFTLAELMIAMAIGIVILGAMSVVFINSHTARGHVEKASRLTESGRYALQVLADDLRLAGFYGEYQVKENAALAEKTAEELVCMHARNDLKNYIPVHVYSMDNVTDAGKPSCITETIKDGSDVLLVRRVETVGHTVDAAGVIVAENPNYYFQYSLCRNWPSNDLFDVSNVKDDWTRTQKDCSPADHTTGTKALVRRVVARIYYVSANNNPGDGVPTLKRIQLNGLDWTSPETIGIADGVEQFQIEMETPDINSSGEIVKFDKLVLPATLGNWPKWQQVARASVSLLVRSPEKTMGYSDSSMTYKVGPETVTGPGDGYKRHVFGSSVEMINVLGRKEM